MLKLEGKTALVVGGGTVALRKVETLLRCGASVKVVSPTLTEQFLRLKQDQRIIHLREEFGERHLDGISLVFAATDDREFNAHVSRVSRTLRIPVNAVDQPEDCDFIVPSVVRRGDLCIAVSTSGRSPALAKWIRKRLDLQFGKEYETFLQLMGRLRQAVFSLGLTQAENSRIFADIVNSDILDALARGDPGAVKEILAKALPREFDLSPILEHLTV